MGIKLTIYICRACNAFEVMGSKMVQNWPKFAVRSI